MFEFRNTIEYPRQDALSCISATSYVAIVLKLAVKEDWFRCLS